MISPNKATLKESIAVAAKMKPWLLRAFLVMIEVVLEVGKCTMFLNPS